MKRTTELKMYAEIIINTYSGYLFLLKYCATFISKQ